MASLAGKVVLVTGASSGIGECIALHLASRGARLSLFGRRADQLERVSNACKEHGTSDTEVCVVAGDVTKDEDRQTLISQTKQRFGQLDALTASDIAVRDYEDVFNTNLKATVFLTQLAIPHLKQTKGNIVNNSSIAASLAAPGVTSYCMSKAALDMYTKCLALDLAPHGVRVNSVNPGVVMTEIWGKAFGDQVDDKEVTEALEDIVSRHPFKRFHLRWPRLWDSSSQRMPATFPAITLTSMVPDSALAANLKHACVQGINSRDLALSFIKCSVTVHVMSLLCFGVGRGLCVFAAFIPLSYVYILIQFVLSSIQDKHLFIYCYCFKYMYTCIYVKE